MNENSQYTPGEYTVQHEEADEEGRTVSMCYSDTLGVHIRRNGTLVEWSLKDMDAAWYFFDKLVGRISAAC